MNWILITVGAIFLVCIIVGICRGAIKIAVSLAATILTLVLVFFATPYVAKAIYEFTPVGEALEQQVISTMADMATSEVEEASSGITADKVKKVLEAAGISEDTLAGVGITIEDIVSGKISNEELSQYGISAGLLDGLNNKKDNAVQDIVENADIPRDMQVSAIEKADLPAVFKDLLATNNNKEIYKELGVETFGQYVGHYLSKLIINIIAFLCTFIIVTIIIRAIVFALDFVSELPVLGILNRLAGGAIGIIGALVIVWTLFIIVTLLYVTDFGKQLYEMIESNQILTILYEYNPIMKLATIFK